jgi:DNA-binding response OmpR family regulator
MRRLRVILVEDDAVLLETVAGALRTEFEVWIARNGEHALAVADEVGYDADVLVVDLALGPGIRGEDFVRQYRSRARRDVPVVVASGVAPPYVLAKAVTSSVVVAKPYNVLDLIRTIRLYGARERTRGEPPQ